MLYLITRLFSEKREHKWFGWMRTMGLTTPVTLRNVKPVMVSRSGVQPVACSVLTVMNLGALAPVANSLINPNSYC
jgi:hypothetical protein